MPALRGIVDDAGSAAGSAWMDVVDTAVHRCAASRRHVTGGMSERCVYGGAAYRDAGGAAAGGRIAADGDGRAEARGGCDGEGHRS
jgi:hypothetical protein